MSDLFYRELLEERNVEKEKARIVMVDLEQEIERLREEELITAEEAVWLKAVFLEFGLLPHDLVDFSRKNLLERLNVLKRARVDITRVRERWVNDWQLDPEKSVAKKIPAGYVAEYIAARAVELGLIEPIITQLGSTTEFGLKVGRRVHFESDLKNAAYVLAGTAIPFYHVNQIYSPLLAALKARAKPLPRERIDPPNLLCVENGVIDLELLEFVETDAVFTYCLPTVNPTFLKRLREGEVEEEYFAGQAFYQVLRKHYSSSEWEKLKAVLGATIVPFSMKLIAIIVGEKNTRKSFLNELLSSALKELAVAVRLRQLEENRFALQHALGARVLLTSEEAQTIVRNVDILKTVTGGDPLYVDRKHLPPVVRRENPLKVIIFSNALPVFKTFDDAFVDRLVIIQAEEPRHPDEKELALIKKSKRQIEDFTEFLIWCYWQLRKNGWKVPGKGDPAYAEMLVEAQNNVARFLKELESGVILKDARYAVYFSQGAKTEAARLYDVYVEWCLQRGETPLGRNNFYFFVEREWEREGVIRVKLKEGVTFRGVYLERKARDMELENI